MKKIFISTLLALTSSLSFAQTWTPSGDVVSISIDVRGYTGGNRILVEHSEARTDSCNNKSGNLYHLGVDNEESKMAYSLILSRHTAQKPVRLVHDGCSAQGYPVIVLAVSVL